MPVIPAICYICFIMISAQRTDADHSSVNKEADELNLRAYEIRNHDPKLSFDLATRALESSEKTGYIKGKADALNNFAFYYLQLTEHEKSLQLLVDAVKLQESIGNETGIANAEYNMAALQLRFANFNLALDALHKSIAIREKQNDKAGLASCYFQMVYVTDMFGHYEESLETGRKALEIRRELNDKVGIAALLTQMGAVHRKMKNYDSSRKMLEEALELRKADDEMRGYFATVFQWVELHIETGELKKAKESASNGHDFAFREKEWFGVMRYCQQLGKIAMQLNNQEEAVKYFDEALKIAQEKKFKSITYEIYESYSELFLRAGNYKSSLEYYKKFHLLKEEVLNAESGARLKSLQMINEIEASKKEAELERVKNVDLKNAFKEIEEKNKEILDSIQYASRIQRALLPQDLYIERYLNNL